MILHKFAAVAAQSATSVVVNKASGVCDHVSVPGLDEWAVAE